MLSYCISYPVSYMHIAIVLVLLVHVRAMPKTEPSTYIIIESFSSQSLLLLDLRNDQFDRNCTLIIRNCKNEDAHKTMDITKRQQQ